VADTNPRSTEHSGAYRPRSVRLLPRSSSPSQQTEEERRPRTDLKRERQTKINWLLRFYRLYRSPPARKRNQEEAVADLPCGLSFTAAHGENAPPRFLQPQRVARHYSKFFWVYFVNSKLFDVMFV